MRRWKFKGIIRQIVFRSLHTEIDVDRLNMISNTITEQVTESINEQMEEYAINTMSEMARAYYLDPHTFTDNTGVCDKCGKTQGRECIDNRQNKVSIECICRCGHHFDIHRDYDGCTDECGCAEYTGRNIG